MPAYFNNFRSSESITWYEPTCICPQEVVGWLQVYFALVVLLRLSHIGQEPSVWGARHGRGDRGRLLGVKVPHVPSWERWSLQVCRHKARHRRRSRTPKHEAACCTVGTPGACCDIPESVGSLSLLQGGQVMTEDPWPWRERCPRLRNRPHSPTAARVGGKWQGNQRRVPPACA